MSGKMMIPKKGKKLITGNIEDLQTGWFMQYLPQIQKHD